MPLVITLNLLLVLFNDCYVMIYLIALRSFEGLFYATGGPVANNNF